MSGKLVQWLVGLPPAARKQIEQSLVEADIARNAGCKDWRNVFEIYQNQSTGRLKKIFSALRKQRNEKAMEAFWMAVKLKQEVINAKAAE